MELLEQIKSNILAVADSSERFVYRETEDLLCIPYVTHLNAVHLNPAATVLKYYAGTGNSAGNNLFYTIYWEQLLNKEQLRIKCHVSV